MHIFKLLRLYYNTLIVVVLMHGSVRLQNLLHNLQNNLQLSLHRHPKDLTNETHVIFVQ